MVTWFGDAPRQVAFDVFRGGVPQRPQNGNKQTVLNGHQPKTVRFFPIWCRPAGSVAELPCCVPNIRASGPCQDRPGRQKIRNASDDVAVASPISGSVSGKLGDVPHQRRHRHQPNHHTPASRSRKTTRMTPKVTSTATKVSSVSGSQARQGLIGPSREADGSGGRAWLDHKPTVSARVPADHEISRFSPLLAGSATNLLTT